jgi:hypothetical protein
LAAFSFAGLPFIVVTPVFMLLKTEALDIVLFEGYGEALYCVFYFLRGRFGLFLVSFL